MKAPTHKVPKVQKKTEEVPNTRERECKVWNAGTTRPLPTLGAAGVRDAIACRAQRWPLIGRVEQRV